MPDKLHIVCPHCHATNRLPAPRLQDNPDCGKCKQALFTAQAIALSSAGFSRHIRYSDIPVIVDFWAPWCGPCKMMTPIFSQAAAQHEPYFRFAKVNTEEEPSLATQYNIRSIPTLAIFKQGKEVTREAGAMDAGMLTQWIQQFR